MFLMPAILALFMSPDLDLAAIQRDLNAAFKSRNVVQLASGFERCGAHNTLDSLQVMLRFYGPTEDITDENVLNWEDHYRLFVVCASSVAKIRDREAVVAMPSLAVKWKHWAGRFVLVAGVRANPQVDAVAVSLAVLKKEKHPLVVAEAVKTLGRCKDKTVIPKLAEYWVGLQKKFTSNKPTRRPSGRRSTSSVQSYKSPEWERVPLMIKQALVRLTGRDLLVPSMYLNYYKNHKDKIDPTKPMQEEPSENRTVLFGLELTGKNIAFVLDISGSMMTTDPHPSGKRMGPRTRVKDGPDALFPNEDRMRIIRAKKELRKVVESLPEDKSFNVIAYSSQLKPWQDRLMPATRNNRNKAVAFIDSLKAQGITLTDYALEMAFQDPIVDTVYLITDGAPTHRGSMGPGLPTDAPMLMAEIIRRLKVLNYRRGVQIFTLGFPGSEESFMKTIARDHGGKYRPIK